MGFIKTDPSLTQRMYAAQLSATGTDTVTSATGEEVTGELGGPSAWDVWGAAFGLENVIGSEVTRVKGAPRGRAAPGFFGGRPVVTDFDPFADGNLDGYEEHADRFLMVGSIEQSNALKRQIENERERRKTIARAGWFGVAASFVAGSADPTIFVPIGGNAKKGESLLKIGGRYALGAGGGAVLSEGILQTSQTTRTMEESALAVGGATFLGGILGPGITASWRGFTGKPIYGFDPAELDALAAKVEAEMVYDPDADPIFEAARVDQAAMQGEPIGGGDLSAAMTKPLELDDYALASTFGTADAMAAVKLNPALRLSYSPSPKAREVSARLLETGMYLNRNREGLATPAAVETRMREYQGGHAEALLTNKDQYKAHKKAKGGLSYRQFRQAISMATIRGGDLTYEDFFRVQRMTPMQGLTGPIPGIKEASSATTRLTFERMKKEAVDVGLFPEDVGQTTAPGYLHRMWKRERLIREPDRFKKMTRAYLGEEMAKMQRRAMGIREDLTRTGAKPSKEDADFLKRVDELEKIEADEGGLDNYIGDSADHIYETLMGYDARKLPIDITAGRKGPLKERTFKIPDLFEYEDVRVEDFLELDIDEVLERYMRVMSAEVELTREFGSPDLKELIEDVEADFAKLADDLPPRDKDPKAYEEAVSELRRKRDAAIQDIKDMRDMLRGDYGTPTYENAFTRGLAAVRTWNFTTYLGGMTLAAIGDISGKVLTHGLMGVSRDLVVPLVRNLGGLPKALTGKTALQREARLYGIAVEQALHTRAATMADIGDMYGRGSTFERSLGAISQNFSTWTGMNLWNNVMKTGDYIAASNRASRIIERPDKAGDADKTWLASMGIGEAEYPRIRKMLKAHGEKRNGFFLSHADKWEDAEARRVWIAALGKNANIQTVTPGVADVPKFFKKTQVGKSITQFKTFVMAGNQRIMLRGMQQAKMGEARVVSALFTYMTLGMLLYWLYMWRTGQEPSDDPAVWVREGVDRSGIAPLFMEAFNSAEKFTGQTFVGESPSSRFASRGQFSALLGPTVGKGEDLAKLATNLADQEYTDKDIHALRKLLPYQNLAWTRRLLDDFEEVIGEATGAEETALSETRERAIIPE